VAKVPLYRAINFTYEDTNLFFNTESTIWEYVI
jgi:hypothetical protein